MRFKVCFIEFEGLYLGLLSGYQPLVLAKFATAVGWKDPFTIAQWLKTSIAQSAAK